MFSLTFDIDLKNSHIEKGSNRNLTNIELQTKLTSLHMTICSTRPAEIEGISLRYSVIWEFHDKVDLRLQPKTKSGLHSHKLPKTRDRIVCPKATFFDWLKRIDDKHGRSIRDNKYGALWWNENITIPAKEAQSHSDQGSYQMLWVQKDQKIMKQQRNYLILVAKWNVIQFQVLNKGEVVGYNIHTPQMPKLDYWQLEEVQQYATTSPWSHPSQVGELLTMISNKLVGMRCKQSFMGGNVQTVR
ncbi:MAG: hypothetical protein EZS28_026371 [Streblomastix strix]|uniref:Uncharacterized protein n=1 Tax=Streblomastix strix TaxID=222440 RepID=A0A5J4V6L1_9EUKA|nr:MAG: hypothetical protein EZS28_026371 [Streblomastix strix]